MRKTARQSLSQIVAMKTNGIMHKQAGVWDDIVDHVKQNKKHYIRGGVGALAGAGLGAGIFGSIHPKAPGAWIGGALGGAGVGAGVGVGGGMLYDLLRKQIQEQKAKAPSVSMDTVKKIHDPNPAGTILQNRIDKLKKDEAKATAQQYDDDGDVSAIEGDTARNAAKSQDIKGYKEPSDLAPGDTPEMNAKEHARLNRENAEAQKNSVLRMQGALTATKKLRENPKDTTLADKVFKGELSARDLHNADNFEAKHNEHVRKGQAQAEKFKKEQKALAQRRKVEEAGAKDRMDALRERAKAQIEANQRAADDRLRRKQFIDANVQKLFNAQFSQLTPEQQRNAQYIKALKDSVYKQAEAMYNQRQRKSPGFRGLFRR